MVVQQVKVRVAFDKGGMAYTYEWPDWWRSSPEVGDVVEVPPNWAFPEGGRVGTVVGIGSDYDGPLATLVRKVEAVFTPVTRTLSCGHYEVWQGDQLLSATCDCVAYG